MVYFCQRNNIWGNILIEEIVNSLNSIIWSKPLIALCLGAGVWFSVRTKFLQLRYFKHMITLLFKTNTSSSGISSFQALSISLSGRVGTGNIAGVATAIAIGGPGAVFWMWVVAFFGASTAFIEATLAQIYKEKDETGMYRGGPAFYIDKAMNNKPYAILFALSTILAVGFCLPGIQANSIAVSVENAWGLSRTHMGFFLVFLISVIIFGGVRRIAKFTQVMVPFMALGYLVLALIIIGFNVSELPEVFTLIISSAFSIHAGFGAIVGSAIEMGVKRGIYSNEAGQGTAPHAAAAAEVSHPVKQGLVQAFSVYIDTLLVCTATALMILLTGFYNVGSADGAMIYTGLPGVEAGPGYVQNVFETIIPGFGAILLAIALFFFAFTTILAYYYIAETNIVYLSRYFNWSGMGAVLKVLLLFSVLFGSVKSAELAWAMGDIGVGLMAWLNIIAILILQKPALSAFKNYENQYNEGDVTEFVAEDSSIDGTDFWKSKDRAL